MTAMGWLSSLMMLLKRMQQHSSKNALLSVSKTMSGLGLLEATDAVTLPARHLYRITAVWWGARMPGCHPPPTLIQDSYRHDFLLSLSLARALSPPPSYSYLCQAPCRIGRH